MVDVIDANSKGTQLQVRNIHFQARRTDIWRSQHCQSIGHVDEFSPNVQITKDLNADERIR